MRLHRLLPVAIALAGCIDEGGPDLTDNDGFDDTKADGKADASQAGRRVVHTFKDRRLFPEGGAFDPTERAFYVGSLEHGSITKVDATGVESTIHAGGEAERYTLGMQVDNERRLLWVCTTKDSLGSIWIYDLVTGVKVSDIDLRTSGNDKAACNDVLLDSGDTALVSDRENSHIYKIDAARKVSVWAESPLLEGSLVSLNSMVFTPDRSAVLTAVYLSPSLVRIGVADRKVTEVDLSGDMFMDGFNLLNGPDDLIMAGDQLIVAFGSSIKRVVPTDASWKAASVKSTRTIGGVTALVRDESKIYGINGQSVRFLLGVTPNTFEIFEIEPNKLR